ncbi:MAG: iron ABC transporter substrate-binding protein [Rhizobiales bacterium PAR1]|nr:MAG: iron ABC transporter substrate-binding protein [Rhizobiales bacterium PAR1]
MSVGQTRTIEKARRHRISGSGKRPSSRWSFLAAWFASSLAGADPSPTFAQPRQVDTIVIGTGTAGAISVVSSSDTMEVRDLLDQWRMRYPDIRLTYTHKNSLEVYSDVAECGGGRSCPDVAWSSAMDLQIKLVNDGHAQKYDSPAVPFLPSWAVWRNEAFGVTAEPILLAYNKKLVPSEDVPHNHTDLIRLLRTKSSFYRGKIAAYDPERSGTGYLFWNSDIQLTADTWHLIRAMGRTGPKLYSFAHTMLDRVSAGDHLFAYNMISSYAHARAASDPAIGVVSLDDYTMVMTRIALIPKKAPNPTGARLFLDFLLSREGQADLARRAFGTVRLDMAQERPSDTSRLRPIHVGPELLTFQDQAKRRLFFREWRKALESD